MPIKDGARSVLIKGGHLTDDTLTDILLTQSEEKFYSSPRLKTVHTHGTGCTLASAVARELLKDLRFSSLQSAPENMCSRQYVQLQVSELAMDRLITPILLTKWRYEA